MRNILKNKIITILLMFLIIISIFSSVFATENTETAFFITINNKEYCFDLTTLKQSDNWVDTDEQFVFYKNGSSICCYYTASHIVLKIDSDGYLHGYDDSGSSISYCIGYAKYNYNSSTDTYILSEHNRPGYFKDYALRVTNDSFIYTNTNIFDLNGNVLFHQPPQIVEPIPEPEQKEITQTLVEEAMKSQIMDQLKITILGFLKYLTVLVISAIAFWKGWKFLLMQLKKA